MAGDELRAQYPGIFGAVRTNMILIEPALARYLVHWLGDYIRLKQQPGQPGVPEGVAAAQAILGEAHAATSGGSRQRERERLDESEIVISGYDACVGTAEAAVELGISADTVRWHCRNGNLESRKTGRQLMVFTASIDNYKRRKAERSA